MAVEESEQVIPDLEREDNLIAAARHIVMALGSKKNLTNDEKKILSDLGSQLSSMNIQSEKEEGKIGKREDDVDVEDEVDEEEEEGVGVIEERIGLIEEKIMKWEEDQSMIWDLGPEETSEYLNAANDARILIDKLESMHLSKEDQEYKFLQRAYSVLQTAMTRLEEEFSNLLIQNRQPFEPEYVSFRSSEEDAVDGNSFVSLGDESFEESLRRDSVSRAAEEHVIDLVHPAVIPDLRCIANLLFASNYSQECAQAYTIVRRDALDECLFILEMERLSIEDVLKMEWSTLNSKIKRWSWAVKIFVRVYLASERWLSDQIFGEGEPVSQVSFVDASKASILQLLNFGEAMSIGPHQPEKLFRILDMYEVLRDLMPDIDALYPDEVGSSVKFECHEVLTRLGDCVRITFLEFKNTVGSNPSTTPLVGGGIHPLARYVMNYLRTLTDYGEALNHLLKDQEEEDSISSSPDTSPGAEEDNRSQGSPGRFPSMSRQFLSFSSVLENNLEEKSKLYKETSLQHLFLMNNLHYMAEKVKGSELRVIFGDEWIRKHNWKFQQHAMKYERASWSSILNLLKDEGIHAPGSNSVSKSLLKEKLRSFYLGFEDIYRIQTAWSIPDVQLREDLRISISVKVIQAYRTFVGRNNSHMSDKNIRYTADDLENYLLDFFEGAQKLLQNPHRR
ncbi:exocyst complex component EXO70E2 [Trifolium pratense]|uniref:exocyst complex component EXO70E2 n=1 Tax=Trifolium pratense TaxID=57577 RepID=UPI001E68FEC0|nr:exocyst complex component EXO70E2 [Trifolium pratense]XP_045793866.1 exocyst complex component EXO70E2 [Trifolium pratense]